MAEPDVETPEADEAPEEAASDDEATEAEASEQEAAEDEALSPFLQQLIAPINDDEPAGAKVTYDDDFQQLKTQINEIGAASGGADYETIVELGRKILTEKSKDLRAAGYLVIGEARLNGAEGMAEAVRGVRLLIDTFWEELYPAKRRMRGRGNALQFIADRLGDWFEITTFEPADREPLVAAREDLKAIQDFGLQEMGEHAPALSGLLKAFDKAIKKLPEPDPEPAEEPEEEPKAEAESSKDAGKQEREKDASTKRPAAARSAAPAEVSSEADAENAVTRAAAYFRNEDKTNPIPYRLMRIIRWDVLRKVPPNEGGTTRIEAPREQRRTYLSGLLEDGDYETLVEEAESSFQAETFHFWLDLQRLLVSALDALGKPYEAACEAVMCDTALLVRRLPKLSTLAFGDGTPFASPLTAEWLDTQVKSLLGGNGEAAGGAVLADGSMPVADHYEEARQQLTSGDLAGALEHMKAGAAQDLTQKERFHRQLYVATLCLKGGKPAVALPLLEDLDDAVTRHALDVWDPPLALEVWTHLCHCGDQMAQQAPVDEQEIYRKRADRAFENICRVDAGRALTLAERRSR